MLISQLEYYLSDPIQRLVTGKVAWNNHSVSLTVNLFSVDLL